MHDEIVIEVPYPDHLQDIDLNHFELVRKLKMIDKIMCSSMQEVCGSVPISCSISVARNWSKKGGYPWHNEKIN